MAKVILPYTANNRLRELIKQEPGKISDKEQKLASYCGITTDAIKSYKHCRTIPSLPIALKIAEYYHARVDDIFTLEG